MNLAIFNRRISAQSVRVDVFINEAARPQLDAAAFALRNAWHVGDAFDRARLAASRESLLSNLLRKFFAFLAAQTQLQISRALKPRERKVRKPIRSSLK